LGWLRAHPVLPGLSPLGGAVVAPAYFGFWRLFLARPRESGSPARAAEPVREDAKEQGT